jgi:hypothetical protein
MRILLVSFNKQHHKVLHQWQFYSSVFKPHTVYLDIRLLQEHTHWHTSLAHYTYCKCPVLATHEGILALAEGPRAGLDALEKTSDPRRNPTTTPSLVSLPAMLTGTLKRTCKSSQLLEVCNSFATLAGLPSCITLAVQTASPTNTADRNLSLLCFTTRTSCALTALSHLTGVNQIPYTDNPTPLQSVLQQAQTQISIKIRCVVSERPAAGHEPA